ncbi:MAG: Rrf2 family transcriptional regulator [Anaerolineales bacterium]|nr:Rrf2 family transcriptional regulator [Anaerolineales bacterium]MCB9144754.1 Rrf2 family transcriptional regulator [Anaerolineales bacterium]
MFRVNRQTDYAVRVVLALSKMPRGTRVPTSEIGREMLIPPSLLQRIVAELASGGFIKTQPGRDGGISLAHLPSEITLLQVVEQFEGSLVISDCILKEGDCPFESKCPVSCQWKRLNDLLRNEMERTTFEQLLEDGKQIEASMEFPASTPLKVVVSEPILSLTDSVNA